MHTFISVPRPGDRKTDWVGFVWFSGWTLINAVLGIGVFRRAPLVALFLAPTFAHEALIAVAFLIRRPLVRQSEGWAPRAIAYTATFLIPAFCFFSERSRAQICSGVRFGSFATRSSNHCLCLSRGERL